MCDAAALAAPAAAPLVVTAMERRFGRAEGSLVMPRLAGADPFPVSAYAVRCVWVLSRREADVDAFDGLGHQITPPTGADQGRIASMEKLPR